MQTDQKSTPPAEPSPPQKKSKKLKQAGLGAILGLLSIFVPLYPVLYLLQTRLEPTISFLPGVIITGLIVIIIALLLRKKWPLLAYTYLLVSLLILSFLVFLFQSFDFA